jgi:HlyD family secretion protein
MNKKRIIVIGIIVIIVLAILVLALFKEKKTVDVKTTTVENGVVQITVTSTGYVQPVQQVSVGTQVSGVIEKLYVDFNSVVKKGDLLATLDMSVLNERLNQSNATLSATQSALALAQQTYDRTKALYSQKAETQTNMEAATNSLSQAKTNAENAKSNVNQAIINLSYAKIYSPIDGVILNRAVEEGQTVAASFNTPTLFLIANDLTKMQVEANMDEADVGGLADGQRVTFTVDAYPDLIFDGTVAQIRLNAVTTNNVVTYTVIINAPNPDKKLFPGMTANITVITQEEQGVVVSMEALNFTPSEELAKHLRIVQQQPDSAKIERKGGEGERERAANGQRRGAENGHSGKREGVWIQDADGSLRYQPVSIGLTDGINAIVKRGLEQGDKVVSTATVGVKSKKNGAVANPLMPRRPGGSQGQRSSSGRPF